MRTFITMNLHSTLPAARSTVGAIIGRTGDLFTADSTVHRAVFAADARPRMTRSAPLLTSQEPQDIYLRLGATEPGQPAIRSVSIKFPDAYGPGRDQDFLLASSGDGAPLHHVTMPVTSGRRALYSSLWLYLVGIVPTLFGVRADDAELGEGDTVEFCVSAPIGRFHRIGTITVHGRDDTTAGLNFAAGHSGGNIRPLPPVSFY